MNILAFETSCDETAVAVVADGRRVLSSLVSSQVEMHALYGGVVPELASRRHIEVIDALTVEALTQAKLSLDGIDAVAVTCAPGLIGALLVGVGYAKGLAAARNLPLVPVHHIRGHIAAAYLTGPEFCPPFLACVVSGGHTLLVDVRDYTDMTVLASTRDDAAGEAFDKISRVLGLGYPGGKALSKLAETGDDSRYILPQSMRGELDMSFSGLKTAAINIIHNAEQKGAELDKPSLAACFEKAVCDTLVPRVGIALKKLGYSKATAVGGVSANVRLRNELKNNFDIHIPPVYFCGDNAAMIGSQAYYEFMAGNIGGARLNGVASLPADSDWAGLCKRSRCLSP